MMQNRPNRRAIACAATAPWVLAGAARADWVAINLNPPGGWSQSAIYAVTPTRQFGNAVSFGSPSNNQPVAWSGTVGSFVAFAQPGNGGAILSASGSSQGGRYNGRASLWLGTPES